MLIPTILQISRNYGTLKSYNKTQTVGGYVDVIPFKYRNYESYPVRLMSGFDDRQTLYWNSMLKATSVASEIVFYIKRLPHYHTRCNQIW